MMSIIGVVFALAVIAFIMSLLLRRRLREKYAILWLVIGVAFLVLALFPDLLSGLAGALGVEVPSNLLFAMLVALLVGVCLHLSWELSTAEEEIRRVAEDVAILRATVSDLTDGPAASASDAEEPESDS